MRFLKEFSLRALLALFYFASVYFAIAALAPAFALQAGLIAAMIAMITYLLLVLTGRDDEGMPMGLLILLPVTCVAAGLAWWLLRLLGLWTIK
jgi:hypothetical protein